MTEARMVLCVGGPFSGTYTYEREGVSSVQYDRADPDNPRPHLYRKRTVGGVLVYAFVPPGTKDYDYEEIRPGLPSTGLRVFSRNDRTGPAVAVCTDRTVAARIVEALNT